MKRRAFLATFTAWMAAITSAACASWIATTTSAAARLGGKRGGGAPVPSVTTLIGTSFPFVDQTASGQTYSSNFGISAPWSGTVSIQMGPNPVYGYNGTSASGTIIGQWMIDETPVGPQISQSNFPTPSIGPPFTLSFNTLTDFAGGPLPDGTHALWFKYLDHSSDQVYNYQSFMTSVVVHNSGYVSGAQTVPTTSGTRVRTIVAMRPDYVAYPGTPNQQNTAKPFPYTATASAGGVQPSIPANCSSPYILDCICNPNTQEYHSDPVWSTLSPVQTGAGDGGVWVQPVTVEPSGGGTAGTSVSTGAYFGQIGINPCDGGRCVNLVSSLITLIEAPDGSAWYGVELQGRLIRVDHNGAVTTIAGFTKDFTKLSYDYLGADASTESMYRTRQTQVGDFSGAGGANMGTAIDLCFDPRNSNIIYVCKQGDSCILKVDKTNPTAVVTVFAGTDGSPGYGGDGGLCNAPGVMFDNCNSIIMDSSGNMYVADTNNCVIRKIASPSAGTPGTITTFLGYQPARPSRPTFESNVNFYSPNTGSLAFSTFAGPSPTSYIPYPFTIRFTSNGDILVMQNENVQVRRINLGSSTVTHIGYFKGNFVTGDTWAWIAVDTAGTIGPVDQIYFAQALSIDGTAQNYWTLPITGGVGNELGDAFGVPGLARCAHEYKWFNQGWGHYPWSAAVSTHEGKAIFNGVSDRGLNQIKIGNPAVDPMANVPLGNGTWSNFDENASMAGEWIWLNGTVAGRGQSTNGFPGSQGTTPPGYPHTFPFQSRPSFSGVHGNTGNGLLGTSGKFAGASSFDEMRVTYPTDAALAAFIQSGMAGSTPRPEITGNDMRDLLYFIYRNSISGSTDNSGTAAQPGPDDPDTGNFPTILTLSAVRNSPTSITVSWTTNKPCIGFAAAGTASQQSTAAPFPVISPIENFTVPYSGNVGGGLTHSATITQCPSGAPMYYTAVAKDMAGNSVHAIGSSPVL